MGTLAKGRGGEVILVVRVLLGVEVELGDNGEVGRSGEEVPVGGIERRFGLLITKEVVANNQSARISAERNVLAK